MARLLFLLLLQAHHKTLSDLISQIHNSTEKTAMELRRTPSPSHREMAVPSILLLLFFMIHGAHSFYLPGVAPQDFEMVCFFIICYLLSEFVFFRVVSYACVIMCTKVK